jgi:hypothetical protein
MAGPKSTNQVKYQRLQQIIKMLTEGRYRYEIVSELSNEWNCSIANVDKYIQIAKKTLSSEISKQDKDDFLSKIERLYSDAIKQGDKRVAIRALEVKAKIMGYEAVKQIDITSGGVSLKDLFKFE